MKTFNKSNLTNIFLILFSLSIILDLHFFYNSISTLIRVLIISIIFLVIFFKYSNKTEKKLIYSYFLLLFIYILFHLQHINNFTNKIPTVSSNIDEILYFYKMSINLYLIYIVYKLNINLENFSKFMKINLWFICGSILLTNILKISYTSYDFNFIKANIFSWFNYSKNTFEHISGKGFFHLANQIIAIIILYFPLVINNIKEKFKIGDLILSFVVLLSMLILGNRLSSIGPLLILATGFLIYIFLILIKKEKMNSKYFTFLILSIVFYNVFLFNSPLLKRYDYYNNLLSEVKSPQVQTGKNSINPATIVIDSEKTEEELINLFNSKKVNINFPLKYYKYENDKEFWDKILAKSPTLLSDARYLEISIIQRVKELNDNPIDNILGIGYSRTINIFNIERDYVMQYYSIGILGTVLLLGMYVIVYLYASLKIFFNLEEKFNYKIVMLMMGLGLFLVSAYFSGNILNASSTIIPLSFMSGILINELKTQNKKEVKILGFKVSNLSSQELLNNIKKDIDNSKQCIIYNINPLIITNFYKNIVVKKEFNNSKYQIPDGIGTVYASKMKNGNLTQRIGGIDFFKDLCKFSVKYKLKIFLYGSSEEVVLKAKNNLEKNYAGIKIIGAINGYVSEQEAIKTITESSPEILFVALGSPKQENFIIKNKNKLTNTKLIMPIGGTLDVISGNKKRVPRIFIEIHLEWLFRMLKEPKRIKANIRIFQFLFLVIFRNNCYNVNINKKGEY